MRLDFLKGLDSFEAYNIIEEECPRVLLKEVVSNPKNMTGKAVVFRGNYDGLATNELCVRIFRYINEEKLWEVSDRITYNGDGTSFWTHFDEEEIKMIFWRFYNERGFLVDV